MKIILERGTNVIMGIATTTAEVTNGIFADKDLPSAMIYGNVNNTLSVQEVESIPHEVVPVEYCYTSEGFFKNPNYVPYVNPEVELAQLKEEQALMQKAIDELLLGGTL